MQQPNGSYSISSEKFSVFVPVSGAYSEWRGFEGVEAYELWRMGSAATSEWNELDLYASNGQVSHDEGWLAFVTLREASVWMREYASRFKPAIMELQIMDDWLVKDGMRLQLIEGGRLSGQLTLASLASLPQAPEGFIRCFWLSAREPGILDRVETEVWRPGKEWRANIVMKEIAGGVTWRRAERVRAPGVRVRRVGRERG